MSVRLSLTRLSPPSRERARASSFFLKSRRGARSPLWQFQRAHGCALGYVASGHLRRGSLGAAADRLNAPALADIYDARLHFSQRIVSPIASIQVLVRCETLTANFKIEGKYRVTNCSILAAYVRHAPLREVAVCARLLPIPRAAAAATTTTAAAAARRVGAERLRVEGARVVFRRAEVRC